MLCQSLCKFESWILSELLKFKIFDLQNSSLVLLTLICCTCLVISFNVILLFDIIYEHIESFYFVCYKLFCQSKANCFILHFYTQTLLT